LSRPFKNLLKIAFYFVFQSFPQLTISLLYQDNLSRATPIGAQPPKAAGRVVGGWRPQP